VTRIIVIDDDLLVREAIRTWLEHESIEVALTESGVMGLSAVEEATFDLALVDIFMPGMDGLQTITGLKALAPALPIIAMSGSIEKDADGGSYYFLRLAIELGATCGLRKPIQPKELMAAIETCVDQSPRERGGSPKRRLA